MVAAHGMRTGTAAELLTLVGDNPERIRSEAALAKLCGACPTDEAVLKLLFLVLRLTSKEWRMPQREWTAAKAQFAILFEDRFATT
jgi:transposase-like protein